MTNVIGRKYEVSILNGALQSNKSELIAIFGRRRIGKTFLVRETYKNNICFEITGIYNVSLKDQLTNFNITLSKYQLTLKKVKNSVNWIEAFNRLGVYLDSIRKKNKKVVFIDEFPWFDTSKSNFLPAFENFWNSYASKRNDIVVVICGSAASYIVNKIIRNKGGLHNRITQKINLKAFNLSETEQMLTKQKLVFTKYDVLQLYMTIGGIPYYIEKINRGESVAQAIDRLCFTKDGFLRTEFTNIFASLFTQHEHHEKIIRILATVRKGFTRNELVAQSKLASGGTLTKVLQELEDSGFIEKYMPYNGSNDSLFRITDEYSVFYIRFIENTKPSNTGYWISMQQQQSFKIWAGYSFETICMKHIAQIKEGLKISGIQSIQGSWIEKNTDNGAQIDLLIDRKDNVINLCEMKFYNSEFAIDKNEVLTISNKINVFKNCTKTRKSIYVTYITTYGLKDNEYSKQLVQNNLNLEHLFVDISN
jgi:hypothetical protein